MEAAGRKTWNPSADGVKASGVRAGALPVHLDAFLSRLVSGGDVHQHPPGALSARTVGDAERELPLGHGSAAQRGAELGGGSGGGRAQGRGHVRLVTLGTDGKRGKNVQVDV